LSGWSSSRRGHRGGHQLQGARSGQEAKKSTANGKFMGLISGFNKKKFSL